MLTLVHSAHRFRYTLYDGLQLKAKRTDRGALLRRRGGRLAGSGRGAGTVALMTDAVAEVAVIGGSGFYEFLENPDRASGRHAVRRPLGADHGRHRRRPPGGVPAAARQAARVPTARASTTGPTCGRWPASACARCWRRARSAACDPRWRRGDLVVPDQLVDRTTRPGRSRTSRPARPTCRSPTRTARALGKTLSRDRRRAAGRHHGGRRGAAVLDPGRVAVLRRAGLDPDQHDRCARGGARPRAAALLRRGRPGHRHGRRRRERRGRRPGRGVRALRPQPRPAQAACSPTALADLPGPRPGCTCCVLGRRPRADLPLPR